MQLRRYCTAVLLALTIPAAVSGQIGSGPDTELTVFIGGSAVGRERVRVAQSGGNWIITSTGTFGAPLNMTLERFELKYTSDWQPIDLHVSATQGKQKLELSTSFGPTTAVNEITQNGVTSSKTDQVSARTIVLPNNFYAGYEGLAARLATTQPGTELPIYVAPQAEIRLAVKAVTEQQLRTPSGVIPTKQYQLTFQNPGGALDATMTIDARARFVRLEIPSAGLAVVRSDLATVATRPDPVRNPTDSDVRIPANGFSIAGTLTLPPGTGRLRHPSVILVAGSGAVGRDEVVAGIPILAQIAGALAEQGFAVVRYDKRGVGQTGGRSESATLPDYSEDLIAVAKWMGKQGFVDPRRIGVVGHSEGGTVAMLAASRHDKIATLVLVSTPGTSGAELILEQQRHLLDVMKASETDRQAKIALQQKIQTAVITDKGWEALPPELRKQAESPWFKSFLVFDPAKVMPKVKQPILIVQGDLDRQVPPDHAGKLEALARARKKQPLVEVVHLPGINHLLVPATTGEVSEYAQLKIQKVSPEVIKAIVDWLKKT
jgi:uncharacterized protein